MNGLEPDKAVKAYEFHVVCKALCCVAMTIMFGVCAIHFESKWLLTTMVFPVLMYFSF